MEVQLTSYAWLQIPHDIRQELVRIFAIPLTGVRRVEYAEKPIVISDGHTFDDLQTLTIEKMQAFLDVEDKEFHILFNKVLEKLNGDKARKEADALLAEEDRIIHADEARREQAVETLVKVGEMAEEVLKPKKRTKKS